MLKGVVLDLTLRLLASFQGHIFEKKNHIIVQRIFRFSVHQILTARPVSALGKEQRRSHVTRIAVRRGLCGQPGEDAASAVVKVWSGVYFKFGNRYTSFPIFERRRLANRKVMYNLSHILLLDSIMHNAY